MNIKNIALTSLATLTLMTSCKQDDDTELNDIEKIKTLEQELAMKDSIIASRDSIIEAMQKYPDDVQHMLSQVDIPKITSADYNDNGNMLSKYDFIKKIQEKVSKHNLTLVLEGSKAHTLFRDSLMLSNIVNRNVIKPHIQSAYSNTVESTSGLSQEKEQQLHDWFVKYIEKRVKGVKTDWDSKVRGDDIHVEKYEDITLYYTDLTHRNPGLIANHPSIQPVKHSYARPSFAKTKEDIFNAADYIESDYQKPNKPVLTIDKNILQKYGIVEINDILLFLNIVNKNQAIPTTYKTVNKIIPTKKQSLKQDINEKKNDIIIEENYAQKYDVNTNGSYELIVWDFQEFDNDIVKLYYGDMKNTIISKEGKMIDIRNLENNNLVIEIISEGTMGKATFAFKIGNHQQEISANKGDKILIKFE